ncbi:MAG: hypothetical protein WAO91_08390 [Candidatus Nitrosotenuis sp.]
MPTKTASVRLEKTLYDRIDEYCVREGCCRNDFIKNAIESALNGNKKDDDVVKFKPHYDSYGNYWHYDLQRKIWVCQVNPKNVKN